MLGRAVLDLALRPVAVAVAAPSAAWVLAGGLVRVAVRGPEELRRTLDLLERAASLNEAGDLLIELNDILINDVAVIPLVNRPADTYGISKRLVPENVAIGVGFELSQIATIHPQSHDIAMDLIVTERGTV